MRTIACLLFLGFFHSVKISSAQSVIPNSLLAPQIAMGTIGGNYSGVFVQSISLPPGKVISEYYLTDYWNSASILLTDQQEVYNFPVKYNIMQSTVELKTRDGIKLLQTIKVRGLVWVDSVTKEKHYFVNGSAYFKNTETLGGLVEVLTDGKMPLLKRTTVYIAKPDYNVVLDVGNRDETAHREVGYYILKHVNAFRVKNKKDIIHQLGDKKEEILSFIEDQNLDVRKEKDLCKVLEFYNAKFPAVK